MEHGRKVYIFLSAFNLSVFMKSFCPKWSKNTNFGFEIINKKRHLIKLSLLCAIHTEYSYLLVDNVCLLYIKKLYINI